MRVLILSDWTFNRGGAERYAVDLKAALREAGDDVYLMSSGAPPDARDDVDGRAFGTASRAAQSLLQIGNPFAAVAVRSIVAEFRPDVAVVSQFAYHLSPSIFRALKGVRTIAMVMDYKPVCPIGSKLLPDGTRCGHRAGHVCVAEGCIGTLHWLRDVPRYARIEQGLRSADMVVVPTERVRDDMLVLGIDPVVVPLAVKAPSPSFRRDPDEAPMFVYSGRLSREKGVGLLLNAFAAVRGFVPEARLFIAGTGPLGDELRQAADNLGIGDSVEFAGWLDPSGVERALARAWALVAPSLWAEPFGFAPVEAIVRRVPVIVSEGGGFDDTVERGVAGLAFPPGDLDALTSRMLAVARGEAFPSHQLEASTASGLGNRLTMRAHADRLRSIMKETAAK